MSTKDKYDLAIEYFESLPEDEYRREVLRCWDNPCENKHGCLFYYVNEHGDSPYMNGVYCGCLTQVGCGDNRVFNNESLTNDIRSIKEFQIKPMVDGIPKTSLGLFADWQRKLDEIWPTRGVK